MYLHNIKIMPNIQILLMIITANIFIKNYKTKIYLHSINIRAKHLNAFVIILLITLINFVYFDSC